ncbi:TPA: lysis protein [Klebsiella oxytoca]|uniref:Lysis protein n=1 Tax=Klebsiella oxytoca TaxID=571 RepID=A0AAN5LD42_KLEOX|nr:lysis protein [Klebsiella oxytoca]
MNRITTGVMAVLVVALMVLAWTADHYHGNAVTYKSQRDSTSQQLQQANDTITVMQQRQRDVAALDTKYTKELADAKAENETLRADVAAGRRRLRVFATCPAVPSGEAPGTASVDNATSPRLADAAQRDYFTLTDRVMRMQKQLEGAQQYIREQCR